MAKKECYIADIDGIIWGAGDSARAARRNAKANLEEYGGNADRLEEYAGDLELTPATSALCRYVRSGKYDPQNDWKRWEKPAKHAKETKPGEKARLVRRR